MPLYEYECESCGRRFERIQKFSDPPVEACPTCGARVRKLISSPAIQFKGSGWYITDYAKSGSSAKSGESSSPDHAEKKPAAEASGAAAKSETSSSPAATSSSSPAPGKSSGSGSD